MGHVWYDSGEPDLFVRGVDEIAAEIGRGMKDYEKEKAENRCFLDGECGVYGRPVY